jgi:hypothetical protein
MRAMVETFLVAPRTLVTAKGDGPAVDITAAAHRVFLLTLEITSVIEQQSLDVSVYGSVDGETWTAKPLVAFPQKFYCGQHPLLLDLTQQSDICQIRAHWEAARWGRGDLTPRFEFEIKLREVTPEVLAATRAGFEMLA